MAKEYWYFLAGVLAIALPLGLYVAAKKLEWFETRPSATLTYGEARGKPLQLQIFRAKEDIAPALLLFHGGGWHSGNPRQFYPHCKFFADNGITCISAAYRLGPGHAPDVRGGIQDAAAALQYLHNHAAQLGIDQDRIFAGGGSSGGHLAVSLGLGMHGGEMRPAGLLLYNPVLDLSPCTPSHHRVRDYWREVSPQEHVAAGLPPTLILSGELDSEVLPAMVEDFCATARRAGNHCEVELYPDQAHGFFNYSRHNRATFDATNERALSFLRKLPGL